MCNHNQVGRAVFCLLFSGVLAACSNDAETEIQSDTLNEVQTDSFEILTAFGEFGSSSKTAQIIAPKLGEYLNQQVEMRYSQGPIAGLGGPTDGNTIVMSTIGLMALLPAVLEDHPIDPLIDLRPITLTAQIPDILVVRSDLGINNIEELVEYSNQHPGELSYHHISPTSIHRLEWAAFFEEFGIEATRDESRSRGDADAMSGIVDSSLGMMISTSSYMIGLIESGAGVPLAVVNPTRMPLFPNVPTLLELGSERMNFGSWAGVFAPAGTSDEHLERIFQAMKYAMSDPGVVEAIEALGMEINPSESPADFSDFIRSEMQRLGNAAQQYNFTTD